MSDDLILKAIDILSTKLTDIGNHVGRGFGEIQRQIDDLDDKVDRRFNVLEQEVKGLRSLIGEVVEMAPDVVANREHLLKLERKQEKFNLRLEDVERRVAGMVR